MGGIHRRHRYPPCRLCRFRHPAWLPGLVAWMAAVIAGAAVLYVYTLPPVHEPVRRFTRLTPSPVERITPR